MDGISAAASITGVIELGLRVSTALGEYIVTVTGATSLIGQLTREVRNIARILEQINKLEEIEIEADGKRVSFICANLLLSIRDCSENCRLAFGAIDEQLKRASRDIRRDGVIGSNSPIELTRWEKALWPFFSAHVGELMLDLDRAKLTLSLQLHAVELELSVRQAGGQTIGSKIDVPDAQTIKRLMKATLLEMEARPVSYKTKDDTVQSVMSKVPKSSKFEDGQIHMRSRYFDPYIPPQGTKIVSQVSRSRSFNSGGSEGETQVTQPVSTPSLFQRIARKFLSRFVSAAPESLDQRIKDGSIRIWSCSVLFHQFNRTEWTIHEVHLPSEKIISTLTKRKTRTGSLVWKHLLRLDDQQYQMVLGHLEQHNFTLLALWLTHGPGMLSRRHDYQRIFWITQPSGRTTTAAEPERILLTDDRITEKEQTSKRPVYPKIRCADIALETLRFYNIEWEYDQSDSDYIIILQPMTERETDMLFAHTSRLRGKSSSNREPTDTAAASGISLVEKVHDLRGRRFSDHTVRGNKSTVASKAGTDYYGYREKLNEHTPNSATVWGTRSRRGNSRGRSRPRRGSTLDDLETSGRPASSDSATAREVEKWTETVLNDLLDEWTTLGKGSFSENFAPKAKKNPNKPPKGPVTFKSIASSPNSTSAKQETGFEDGSPKQHVSKIITRTEPGSDLYRSPSLLSLEEPERTMAPFTVPEEDKEPGDTWTNSPDRRVNEPAPAWKDGSEAQGATSQELLEVSQDGPQTSSPRLPLKESNYQPPTIEATEDTEPRRMMPET